MLIEHMDLSYIFIVIYTVLHDSLTPESIFCLMFYVFLCNTFFIFRSQFLNIWALTFSFLSQFVYMYLPGKQPLEYHLCSGSNPKADTQAVKYHLIVFFVYFISILVNTLIPVRIYIRRRSEMIARRQNEIPSVSGYADEDFEILTDLTTSFFIVLLMGANLYTFIAADR